jgi:hypothetical protein
MGVAKRSSARKSAETQIAPARIADATAPSGS